MSAANIAMAQATEELPSPVARNRIVAFVNDDLSAAALRTGLEGANLDVKRGDIRTAIRLLEDDTNLLAVIADIADVDDPIGALEHLSQVCPGDVMVALIGDRTDMAFYRTVVNDMGVREYLPKPLTRDSVQINLRPKLIGDEANPVDRGGHVVSICGAQGGAGATSIAINFALQLAETTKAKVALLDLHLQGGETAVMLGVQDKVRSGLRVALEDPMQADTLFLDRAAIDINDRVKLIAGDEALNAELHITEAGVRHVMGLLRKRFSFIVVDVPVPLTPAVQSVISLSRHVMVLLEAEITGLRNAHALRTAILEIAGKNRVLTVLNRANRAGGLATAHIAKGLGQPDIIIPDLGKRMVLALNDGVPAIQRIPSLRRHLAPLVREVAGIGAKKRGWIERMLGR